MYRLEPTVLLLGEAPGYKGCRLTGIPFTSERILHENKFFAEDKYRIINENGNFESEASATIVWEQLNQIEDMPLIWNIFPYHPYKPGNKISNRTPNRQELYVGFEILEPLLDIFSIETIIAVGRKPEAQLSKSKHSFTYIRHPANGGKQQFVEGLRSVMK